MTKLKTLITWAFVCLRWSDKAADRIIWQPVVGHRSVRCYHWGFLYKGWPVGGWQYNFVACSFVASGKKCWIQEYRSLVPCKCTVNSWSSAGAVRWFSDNAASQLRARVLLYTINVFKHRHLFYHQQHNGLQWLIALLCFSGPWLLKYDHLIGQLNRI